jgi:hypothetical protein
MAIPSLHPYAWDSVYKAAVLEPENPMLEQRIEVAQEALLTRWLELTQLRGDMVEIRAIVDATDALRALMRKHRAA